MYRTTIFLALLTLASVASGGARADVVYNWVNLEPGGPDDITVQATLSINDAYWSLGGALQSKELLVGCCGNLPIMPYFGLDRISVTAVSSGVICSLFGTGCLGITESGPGACGINCPGAPDTPMFGDALFSRANSFDLNTGLFLTGSIGLYDIDTEVYMHSDGIFWTVTRSGSDPSLCNGIDPYIGCGGQVGVWVLDLASLPVPEPATLALVAIGLAGLGFTRRRKVS